MKARHPSTYRFAAALILVVLLALAIWRMPDFHHPGREKPVSDRNESQAQVQPGNEPGDPAVPSPEPDAQAGNPSPAADSGDERSSVPFSKDEPAAALPPSTRALAGGGKSIPEILKNADLTDPAVRERVVREMREFQETQHLAVIEKARVLGVPLRIDGPGHKVSILHDFRGDEPLYRTTLNANAAISTGANLLIPAPYSLNGSGIKIGIWDGGSVRSTHQELTGRVTKKNSSAANDDHATHVAGTIGASGVQANAKGMAPQIAIDSYDWDNDYTEMTAAGTVSASDSAGVPLSNHSYGYNAVTADMGRYETEAAAVDAVAAALPYYLPFWAAGNEQDVLTSKGGFQSITFNGLAKNLMTIGAADDAVTSGTRDPSKAVIAYFSSLGPCDDGRIKPDLVANGIDLYSSIATSNTAYDGTYSGTSMATPNALGSASLLVQLYAREFSGQRMRASTLKGLMIHTANDIGTAGPDYTYGWGLVNVKAAADLILAHKASLAAPKMIEGSLTNASKTASHSFTWDGSSPIRTTLCWTEPAGVAQTGADSRTRNVIHNLDVKITAPDGTTVLQPYVMPFVGNWSTAYMSLPATTGKNNVDNVEQVYLASPTQPGNYTVTVSLDGTLTTASQVYSLIVTGGTDVEANPPPNLTLTSPSNGAAFLSGVPVTVSATATDLTVGGAPGAVTQVEFFRGATSLGVDTTAPYSIDWTPSASGVYSLTAKATDNEGAVSVSAAASITVLSGDGSPVIASFNPTSGPTGSSVVLTGGNFVGVTAVSFNGVAAEFIVDSSGQITAIVPGAAASGVITVVNGYGTGTSAAPFTVLESPVLVSQIYGAGGNSGAVLNKDYIELYNRSASAVSLTGWSVQYASETGTSWQSTALSGTLDPGKYYLVALAGGSVGSALPTPDANGTVNISATKGKVALRNSTTLFTGSSPTGAAGLQDFVGYGSANASETSPAPAGSTTTAIFRIGGGSTDTGNNSADFTVATPLPRNTSTGAPSTPVITSAATATATAGTAFSYQITASNTPTSFDATVLPGWLSVNTSTGLISGTPSAAGTVNLTISATNTAGTGTASLAITINPASGGGGTVIFSENMGTPSGTTSIASNTFQNSGFTFTGTADVRNTTVSTGYTGASGGGNVFITSSVGRNFEISGINTAGYTDLSLSFGQHKSTTASSNELVVEVSSDGATYTPLSYSRATGSGTANWLKINPTGTIPSAANLRIRFTQTSATPQFRIDDVVLSGTASGSSPLITTSGTLASTPAIYGSASSTTTSFTVSGTGMAEGILVTPPAGFEVSQTSASSGYAATQLVGAAGSIAETTIHVRLAAGTTAGSYSGDIVCTSAGAAPANVATAISDVNPKIITVTADDLTKPYGSTLSLGAGQTTFTASGLVGTETIGSVTISASGGTAAADAPGSYDLTPSAATGGTFDPQNYDIDYQNGALTVTPLTFENWLTNYPGLSDTTAGGDPDADGFSNLLEYYLGLNPGQSDAANAISVSTSPTTVAMTYRRAKGIGGVTGVVKWSATLVSGSWSASGISENETDMGTYYQVTATLPRAPGDAAKFLRLEVTRP